MGAGFAQLAERSVVGVCIGILLKFMLGSDDLVWLSPFMAKASLATKVRMGYKYVGTVFVLTVIAVCVALGLTSAAGSDERVADARAPHNSSRRPRTPSSSARAPARRAKASRRSPRSPTWTRPTRQRARSWARSTPTAAARRWGGGTRAALCAVILPRRKQR